MASEQATILADLRGDKRLMGFTDGSGKTSKRAGDCGDPYALNLACESAGMKGFYTYHSTIWDHPDQDCTPYSSSGFGTEFKDMS